MPEAYLDVNPLTFIAGMAGEAARFMERGGQAPFHVERYAMRWLDQEFPKDPEGPADDVVPPIVADNSQMWTSRSHVGVQYALAKPPFTIPACSWVVIRTSPFTYCGSWDAQDFNHQGFWQNVNMQDELVLRFPNGASESVMLGPSQRFALWGGIPQCELDYRKRTVMAMYLRKGLEYPLLVEFSRTVLEVVIGRVGFPLDLFQPTTTGYINEQPLQFWHGGEPTSVYVHDNTTKYAYYQYYLRAWPEFSHYFVEQSSETWPATTPVGCQLSCLSCRPLGRLPTEWHVGNVNWRTGLTKPEDLNEADLTPRVFNFSPHIGGFSGWWRPVYHAQHTDPTTTVYPHFVGTP